MSSEQKRIHLKLLTLGDKLAGKSCFIKRYCEKKFESKYLPTIGIDYGVKKVVVREKVLSINIFDTSGDETYQSIRREFYDNTNVGG